MAIAKAGNLEVLKWAVRNGWPSHATCVGAAGGGHLEVLKWARENGCPWNEFTCAHAAEGDHLEVLDWVHENGCPCHCLDDAGHLSFV